MQSPESPTQTPASLMARLRESNTKCARIIFLDYNGLARARSVSLDALPQAFERGVNFSSPTVDFNSRDAFPPEAAFDLASPDFWARPDPSTCRPAAASDQTVDLLSDLVQADGESWEGCPRAALRRVVEQATAHGLAFLVAFEPEGYVFRRTDREVGFVGAPQFATLDGLDLEPRFIGEVLATLKSAGIQVIQWSEEYGPGQVEINLRHLPALESTDAFVTFRYTFRAVARKHSLHGTFMPKPFGQHAGSGLHVHLSAASPNDHSQNLFDDCHDSILGLSALGRHALGGLLAHGEALTALGATTVNSYKRFLPGSWAPTHITYAYASRAAYVRVPERETPRRLELRVGDAAGNPYLYLTAILAAMLDGIDRRLDPGPATPGDVGAVTAKTAASHGLRPVPSTLEHALDHLAADPVLHDALGPLIVEEFIKIKRSEWDAFRQHVSDWDRTWYLDRY
jgi:glutamine synthetase